MAELDIYGDNYQFTVTKQQQPCKPKLRPVCQNKNPKPNADTYPNPYSVTPTLTT